MKKVLLHTLAAALLVTGVSALPACNGARDTALSTVDSGPKGFMVKELVRGERHRKYGLFIPASYNAQSSTKYPVIIFLHGIGEGGSDAHANLRVGLAPFVADQMSTFNFICIFPQSDNGSWDENSENATDVIACLDAVSKQYPVDQDRVCLTGLSTGGYGTYAIGAKYKDRFAALVPMGSNASADKWCSSLVDMPIHAFCNGGDLFGAFGGNDRGMIERIKSLGGTKAEFTQTDGPGHDCWEGVYSDGAVFTWMAQQSRASRTGRASTSAMPVSAPAPVAAHAPANPIYETKVRDNGGTAVVPTPY